MEHAAMLAEWLRRNDEHFAGSLAKFLKTKGPIISAGDFERGHDSSARHPPAALSRRPQSRTPRDERVAREVRSRRSSRNMEAAMGLIRKTVSVGTFGIISFRSKKENLRRADRSRRDAEAALEVEQTARVAAEARITAAEKRVKHASAQAAEAAKRLEQAKRRTRRGRRTGRLGELLAAAEPIVRSGVESARNAGSDAAERGRKASRRTRKAAKRAARDARKGAERSLRQAKATASSTNEALAPHAERVAARAGDALDQLSNR
jgi:hypothetical protein